MRHDFTALALCMLSVLPLSGCAEQPSKSHDLELLGTSAKGQKVYYTSPQPMSSYLVTVVVFVPPGSTVDEIVRDPANSGVMVFDCHGGFAPSFREPTMLIPRGSVVGALETAICPSRR